MPILKIKQFKTGRIKDVEVPNVRECPSCKGIISIHTIDRKTKRCICSFCKTLFCFICLALQTDKTAWKKCGRQDSICQFRPNSNQDDQLYLKNRSKARKSSNSPSLEKPNKNKQKIEVSSPKKQMFQSPQPKISSYEKVLNRQSKQELAEHLSLQLIDINKKKHKMQVNPSITSEKLKKLIHDKFCSSLLPKEMALFSNSIQLSQSKPLKYILSEAPAAIIQERNDLGKISSIKCLNIQDPITCEPVTAEMPCKHLMGKEAMLQLLTFQIQKEKYDSILCPHLNKDGSFCLKEWDLKLCEKIAVCTAEEKVRFQAQLAQNWISKHTKPCPSCKFLIRLQKHQQSKVQCPQCKCKFCWICLKQWKSAINGKTCGNQDCQFSLKFASQSQEKEAFELEDRRTKRKIRVYTPKYRICPSCHKVIEHTGGCKHVSCPYQGCKTSFCFVCLSILDKKWQCGSYKDYCGKVAPVQKLV